MAKPYWSTCSINNHKIIEWLRSQFSPLRREDLEHHRGREERQKQEKTREKEEKGRRRKEKEGGRKEMKARKLALKLELLIFGRLQSSKG